MIIRWGRKGLVTSAIAATFVTAVAAPAVNYVKQANVTPSHKLEFRHVTPVVTAVSPGIHRYQVRYDNRLEFRHLTPVEVAEEVDEHTPGYYGVDGIIAKRKKEDDELIAIIMAMYESGAV